MLRTHAVIGSRAYRVILSSFLHANALREAVHTWTSNEDSFIQFASFSDFSLLAVNQSSWYWKSLHFCFPLNEMSNLDAGTGLGHLREVAPNSLAWAHVC